MAKDRDRRVGKRRIIETSAWDRAYLNLVGPAFIAVDANGHGEMAFGALEASLDCASRPTASTSTGTAPMKATRSAAKDGLTCATTASSKAKSPTTMATKPASSPPHGSLFQQPAKPVSIETGQHQTQDALRGGRRGRPDRGRLSPPGRSRQRARPERAEHFVN